MEPGHDYYDLLEPQRNQHVFFNTYLDYTRLLVANTEAVRNGNHPLLAQYTHVPSHAWRDGANATLERRRSNDRPKTSPPPTPVDMHP